MPIGPNGVELPAIQNVGDLLNPRNWVDANGNTPPQQFNNLDPNTIYPNNGDSRMWWGVSGFNPGLGLITFIGNTEYLKGNLALTWQVTDGADDGSVPVLQYSTNGGTTFTTVALSDTLQMGLISIAIPNNATGFQFQVIPQGGGQGSNDGTLWYVAVSITRQDQPPIASWQAIGSSDQGPEASGLDPYLYNPQINDPMPFDDLSTLQSRIITALGFSAQQANPPPGVLNFVTEKLTSSNNYLYRKYPQLHLRHYFRYKLIPGQPFYSIYDNDEDVNNAFIIDVYKPILWAGAQDVRSVWYPLVRGIDPALFTMVTKPWRPARFEIRQTALQIYPVPDQTYWVWLYAHAGMGSFVNPTDLPSVDSELLYLHSLAICKGHYGQQDAGQILAMSKDYLGELTAGTHTGRRYVPKAAPLPPAVRPTLTQFEGNND